MKKPAPKMTLEKLAMMVANGFTRVDEKFEKIDKDLQSIRGDILKQHDKFVSQEVFTSRISALETRVKAKAK